MLISKKDTLYLLESYRMHIGKSVSVRCGQPSEPADIVATGTMTNVERTPEGIEATFDWTLLPSVEHERAIGHIYVEDRLYLGSCWVGGSCQIQSCAPHD